MALTKEDLLAISQLLDEKLKVELQPIKINMATKDDISNMATKDDISNMATKDDIDQIRSEIRESSNLVLRELDRVEQKVYKNFEKIYQDMAMLHNEVHITKYSNETVELLLKKVTELEKRIAELEEIA